MTGPRYIALIAKDRAAREAWHAQCRLDLVRHPGFAVHDCGERLALLANPGSVLRLGREGFVVGRVFGRGSLAAIQSFDDVCAREIVASRGDWLVRAYWGSYVALMDAPARNGVEIVRAAFGDLACYSAASHFGLVLASDIDLLERFAGYRPRIDWRALAQHLAAPDLPRRTTCLEGVDELAAGERLSGRDGRIVTDHAWSPWDHVGAVKRLCDAGEAASRVGDAVRSTVAARAGSAGKIMLCLSGGLDSSIVAACLARSKVQFVALTLVTRDRGGDERAHARSVASQLGVPLVEAYREVAHVDLERSDASALPRPSARAFNQSSARLARDAAESHGVSAIFDGGGGDNMFASLQSPAPVADCLDPDGGIGHFWSTARSIGLAAQTSTLTVARRALLRAWRRGPEFRWPIDLGLLSDRARECAARAAEHRWLEAPEGALPGSAAHIALLAAATTIVQNRDHSDAFTPLSPLVSQPVAEVCLRVPSWLWTRDGRNRAIARDAFRGDLPAAIIDRRDKGAPDSFVVEIVDANRALIGEMLTGGVLAREGMLDRGAVEAALAPRALAKGVGYVRLAQLVDTEAWLRAWIDRPHGGPSQARP